MKPKKPITPIFIDAPTNPRGRSWIRLAVYDPTDDSYEPHFVGPLYPLPLPGIDRYFLKTAMRDHTESMQRAGLPHRLGVYRIKS